jgi:hypothetical protein
MRLLQDKKVHNARFKKVHNAIAMSQGNALNLIPSDGCAAKDAVLMKLQSTFPAKQSLFERGVLELFPPRERSSPKLHIL